MEGTALRYGLSGSHGERLFSPWAFLCNARYNVLAFGAPERPYRGKTHGEFKSEFAVATSENFEALLVDIGIAFDDHVFAGIGFDFGKQHAIAGLQR